MKKRGFEIVTKYMDQQLRLPQRATHHAAGYDFEAAEDVVIPSIWKAGFKQGLAAVTDAMAKDALSGEEKKIKPVLVPTGIKAYMGEDEFLQLANRSSNPLKRFLILTNGVGVIDSDYYNNEANEGHIMFQFTNFGFKDVVIKKGERIGQGIFLPFLKADQDQTERTRQGGFGSSNEAS
ncbi:dUTP pyrophosphatase [Enterococcus sp. 10A9_DIV0425]|uniref:dUTP diphosphatase n=1 Tax=Candidatus Enterococcus wittei TaxID=1987383 RepID=A0A242JXB6_9ENTE|nr:dUTP diphosphatase [Enterococcus sp. 10A9_DIV0425]OTP06922.1 dUTP pyrophosphatase [Enterococcus sp. 10A9_DIV0425]THE15893.1 dUTP diphosphatase [Enterococcus hirae]